MGGATAVPDMQWTACGREGACAHSLIRSDSLMAVTWRKRSKNGLKWRKIMIWGAFWGNWEAKLNFLPSKPKKMKFLGNLEFFHLFFFFEFWSKKKPFWTEKGPILVEKQVSKIFFFSANLGCKNFSPLITD